MKRWSPVLPARCWGGGSVSRGVPIGNLTSQIFANIYLNELDQFIKHGLKIKHYFRYADDFIIVHNNSDYLAGLVAILHNFLNQELYLELHPNKISVRKLRQGVDFLGYIILPWHIALRTKTKKRMFKKLFQKQTLLEQDDLDEENFKQTVQSYLGLLSHCNAYGLRMAVENNFGTKQKESYWKTLFLAPSLNDSWRVMLALK